MAASRTVRVLMTRAMRVATIVGSGETPSPDDADDALLSLNMMLDAWQADRLYAYAVLDRTKALTSGTGQYTVGSGGAINVARPVRIEWAYTRDANSFDRPIEVTAESANYAALALKALSGAFPSLLYYQARFPLGYIELFPLPGAGLTLHFGAWEVLSEFAALGDTVSVPPGYEDALVFSLAERLCVEYEKPISAALQAMARTSRARIMGNNLPEPLQVCEFGVPANQSLAFQSIAAG